MKNLLILLGLLAVICVPVMAQQSIEVPQVQVGTFRAAGETLVKGSGDRQLTVAISFDKPFKVKPNVIVSITAIDAESKANIRINTKAEGISRDGFTVVIKTWADSKIHSVEGSWVAVATNTVKVK